MEAVHRESQSARKLMHATEEAEQFYRRLRAPSLVGMESVGNSQWFVQLLEQLGHEVRIGDAAQFRASYVRKQKTDKRDACHILKLLVEDRFPYIWVPDARFVEVQVAIPDEPVRRPAEARSSAIEIRLREGRSLVVEPGFEAGHLRALLAVLESEA
jgi:transposase